MHCVVCLTYGMSLRKWHAAGLLDRELALYRELIEAGHRITLLSYGDYRERAFLSRVAPIEVAYNRWNLPRTLYAWAVPFLHRQLWSSCDLLKTNQMEGADVARRVAGSFQKPWIARGGYLWGETVRRLRGDQHPAARQAWAEEQRGYQHATRIVVTTPEMARAISERVPQRAADIRVVPNFVDTDLFRPFVDRRSPRPSTETASALSARPASARSTEFDLVFAGRLAVEKNLPVLLGALRGTSWRALIIGDGPLREEWQRASQDLAPDQVHWQGKVANAELPGHFARARFFVLPSLFEGQPKVLLEAMACGLPAIVADRPGLRDAVQHGRTGWLFDGTSGGLRAAIHHLLSQPQLAADLAHQARQHVVTSMSLSQVASAEESVYAEAVGASSDSARRVIAWPSQTRPPRAAA